MRRALKLSATTQRYRGQEIQTLPRLANHIALAKIKYMVDRPTVVDVIGSVLQESGVCVLHGFGGVGKSTLAAHYGYER